MNQHFPVKCHEISSFSQIFVAPKSLGRSTFRCLVPPWNVATSILQQFALIVSCLRAIAACRVLSRSGYFFERPEIRFLTYFATKCTEDPKKHRYCPSHLDINDIGIMCYITNSKILVYLSETS